MLYRGISEEQWQTDNYMLWRSANKHGLVAMFAHGPPTRVIQLRIVIGDNYQLPFDDMRRCGLVEKFLDQRPVAWIEFIGPKRPSLTGNTNTALLEIVLEQSDASPTTRFHSS